MNKILKYIITAGILIIIGILGIQYIRINKLVKENARLTNNITALKIDHNRQLIITKGELNKFYGYKIDSLTKALGIKMKNVKNIVVTKYVYKDTTIAHLTFDTVKISNKETFLFQKNCLIVDGVIDSTGITFDNVILQDKLTTFLYKDYEKKFLFIKWKPYYTSKIYSECLKEIVEVETNIKVIK